MTRCPKKFETVLNYEQLSRILSCLSHTLSIIVVDNTIRASSGKIILMTWAQHFSFALCISLDSKHFAEIKIHLGKFRKSQCRWCKMQAKACGTVMVALKAASAEGVCQGENSRLLKVFGVAQRPDWYQDGPTRLIRVVCRLRLAHIVLYYNIANNALNILCFTALLCIINNNGEMHNKLLSPE